MKKLIASLFVFTLMCQLLMVANYADTRPAPEGRDMSGLALETSPVANHRQHAPHSGASR
jgi:hypothetical protein